jgi:hypothetical protein
MEYAFPGVIGESISSSSAVIHRSTSPTFLAEVNGPVVFEE